MSNKEMSRREFIKFGSSTLAALGIGGLVGGWFDLGDGKVAIAASEGS